MAQHPGTSPTGNVLIREADKADAVRVFELIREHLLEEAERVDLTESYVERYLAFGSNGILLAGDPASGLLAYSIRPDLGHAGPVCLIEELIVSRAFRGRGIGGALVEELLRRATAAGCREISVAVMPRNADAQRFYKAHGLVEEAVLLEKHPPH